MRNVFANVVTMLAVAGMSACGGGMTTSNEPSAPLPSLRDVSDAQWASLAKRQIFFGHQSVGGNIMAGVADLMAEHPQIKLNVVESRDLRGATTPGFRHALVGRNHFPLEKFDDFLNIASNGFSPAGGVAMVKLCFTDVDGNTDARGLFAEYQRRIADLRTRNPAVTVVHFTMPLTGIENWKGRVMGTLRGRATQRELNVIRQRYNDLVRQTYGGKEPLVDVARLESRLPDGRRQLFRSGDESVEMLVPQYTDDGSHLNAAARRIVAEQFLITLARLEPSTSVASHAQPRN
jgi:hypothetical protein